MQISEIAIVKLELELYHGYHIGVTGPFNYWLCNQQ